MDSRRDFTMPRSMAMISSSGILSMPLGRAAMSVSFSLAMIMRRVEVRSAVPAFIDSFIWSVKVSLRLMASLLRGKLYLYIRWCRCVTLGAQFRGHLIRYFSDLSRRCVFAPPPGQEAVRPGWNGPFGGSDSCPAARVPAGAAQDLFDNNRADPRCRTSPKLMFCAATLLACCRTYLPALPQTAGGVRSGCWRLTTSRLAVSAVVLSGTWPGASKPIHGTRDSVPKFFVIGTAAGWSRLPVVTSIAS